MVRRTSREKRALGLWTASWLALLLLAGLLWIGDLSVQWPVFLVPALWALLALRSRRPDRGAPQRWQDLPAPVRTDTVEQSYLRPDRGRGPRR